ncbi:hypothetical protein [uncultured Pseudosulfitobacter sp.]|uniref:hypothetical protein n=1 Tax=uncultured Pseudosulfitobacter sp. TaxID=2854214 RepID=UPI0030D804D4|tara:strand:- start:5075 stop:6688 length:1614 start_codon:yes stop_codon:yes gene_type:complete
MEIMMSERRDVGDFLSVHARPVFQSSTQVVDTYVQPAQQPRSKGEALAVALTQLDDAMSPVLKKGIRQAATREHEKGEELFQKNRKDFAEAVRSGEIPMGASPFVRRGYRESQLHVLGATYNVELKRALEHSNLSEVEDPAEVEQFIQAFNEKFREENGLENMPRKEVNRIFTPMAVQSNDSFRNQQAAENIQLVEERRFRAFEQELHMAVTQGRFSGPPGSAAADAKNLGEWLNARAQDMGEEGIDYKLIEGSILNAVGSAAATRGSVSMAGVLNNIEVAGMGSLGQSAKGRKVQSQVRSAASRIEARRNSTASKAVAAERKAELNGLMTEAQQAAKDGDFERAEELWVKINQMDPTKARSVDGFLDGERTDEDRTTSKGAFAEAAAAVGSSGSAQEAEAIIDEMVIFGKLDPADANQLRGVAERRHAPQGRSDPLGAIEGDNYLNGQRSRISDSFPKTEFGQTNPTYADDVARAQSDYEDEMIIWMQNNRDEDGNYDRLAARAAAQAARERAVNSHLSDPTGTGVTDPDKPDWAD